MSAKTGTEQSARQTVWPHCWLHVKHVGFVGASKSSGEHCDDMWCPSSECVSGVAAVAVCWGDLYSDSKTARVDMGIRIMSMAWRALNQQQH